MQTPQTMLLKQDKQDKHQDTEQMHSTDSDVEHSDINNWEVN